MKDGSKIAKLATLLEQNGAHDAGYETLKLQRTREIYGALYQRMQDLMRLDEEGYEISITISSPTHSLRLTSAEAEAAFDFSALFQVVGNKLNARHDEIIDSLLTIEKGHPINDAFSGTDNPLMREALALCLPDGHKVAAQLQAQNTTSAS